MKSTSAVNALLRAHPGETGKLLVELAQISGTVAALAEATGVGMSGDTISRRLHACSKRIDLIAATIETARRT